MANADRNAELDDRQNGFELNKGCMKCLAIGNLSQSKLLPGSSCMFNHRDLEIFDTNGKPQRARDYMFVLMASNQIDDL